MAATEVLHEYEYGGQTFYQVSGPKLWDAVSRRLAHDCMSHARHYRLGQSDGRRMTWLCCEVCGRKIQKSKPPLSAWVEDGEETIARKQADWQHRRDRESELLSVEAVQEAEALNQAARAVRESEYAAYRRSPGWRQRRALVLRRCAGVCEGCGEAAAAEVHHLTYAHFGRELLFELVALCPACHRLVHFDADYDDLEAVA